MEEDFSDTHFGFKVEEHINRNIKVLGATGMDDKDICVILNLYIEQRTKLRFE